MVKLTIEADYIREKIKTTQYSISANELDNDLTISEFFELCKKLAVVYGYQFDNVNEYFPEEKI